MTKKRYLILNIIIAGIFLAIIVWCSFHRPAQSISVNCIHTELLGAQCPVCGFSQSFSQIVRGNMAEATQIQPNSISVFLFLLIQIVMRFLVKYLLASSKHSLKLILNTDLILSSVLFVFLFRNIILQSIYIFYKMLLTGNIG